MTVADAGIEMAGFTSEMRFERLDQFVSLGGSDLVCRVIQHDLILVLALIGEGDYVTTICGLVGRHGKTHADGLQRRATSGVDLGVKGEDGHVGGVTLGHHAVRDVRHKAYRRAGSKCIHAGLDGSLHGGAVAKGGNGTVSHAVGDQDKILHRDKPRTNDKIKLLYHIF